VDPSPSDPHEYLLSIELGRDGFVGSQSAPIETILRQILVANQSLVLIRAGSHFDANLHFTQLCAGDSANWSWDEDWLSPDQS